MKICFINSNPFWGGAEKWHVEAAKFLHGRGHEVRFVARTDTVADPVREAGIDVKLLGFRNDFDPFTFFPLWSILRRFKPDTVILNCERDLRLGGVAARAAGVRVRIHRKGISGLKLKPRYRWIYRNFRSHTLCVADAVRREIAAAGWVDPASLRVIYTGVDLDKFTPEGSRNLRAELGVAEDELLVGSLARLSSIKGLEYFIDAMPAILREAPNVRFALVGTGRLEDELKERARSLGLGDKVAFTGFRSDSADALRSFDVFVLPSVHSEGFPNSVVEAMASARPCVGTTIAGIPEAIVDDETGLLVPPRDANALAEAILELAGNPDRRREMGIEGRKRAEAAFGSKDRLAELENWLAGLTL